jgi:Heavy-metal resistance protein CzcE
MKNAIRYVLAAAGFVTAMATITTTSAANYPRNFLGYPANADSYTRTVTIGSNSRWVNVNYDETVNFVNSATGAHFVWRFYTPAGVFDLSDVSATEFMNGQRLRVYVGDDPTVN